MAASVLAALERHALESPDRVALRFVRGAAVEPRTYAGLHEETERWAATFARLDLEPDSIVAIVLDHRIEMYAAYFGAMRAGLVPTFLAYPTPKQHAATYWESQRELFARIRPACVLSYRDVRERLVDVASGFPCVSLDVDVPLDARRAPLPPLRDVERPDRIALLQHSSGTTGAKKGVALTFGAIREQTAAHAAVLGAASDDTVVSWLPLYHDMGLLTACIFPITLGNAIVAIDAFEWLAKPALFFETIERYRGTHAWLPNFALNHLARTHDSERRYNLSSLRTIVSSSETCKPATFALFEKTFAPHGLGETVLRSGYGMAEAVYACTLTRQGVRPRRHAVTSSLAAAGEYLSCGAPLPGLEMRVRSTDGSGVGEIQIRGAFVFDGYFRSPIERSESFDGDWYRTGDIGFMYDGEAYLCGRIKEMLIVHGANYYANDIEAIVDEVAGVKPGRSVAFAEFYDDIASEEAIVLAESAVATDAERAALVRAIRAAVFDRIGLTIRHVAIYSPGRLVKTTSGKMSRSANARAYRDERRAAN